MNTSIIPLDTIGHSIIHGQKPYHTTDEYKQKLSRRISWIIQEKWEDSDEQSITKLINTCTKAATQEEREEIVKSIEEECILPFDPKDLNMFKEGMLMWWIQQLIEKKVFYPQFLTLWSAKIIGGGKEWWWKQTLWPIELNLSQYNNQLYPVLDENETKELNLNPYRILMKINYLWQDELETLPSKDDSQIRQWRRRYDISFVVLQDTNKTPWYTLIKEWFHVNKKEMNKEEFIKWFEDNEKNIVVPKSIDSRSWK